MVAVLALASATATQAGNITAKGSDTLVILAQKWAEVYMAKTPGTTIQVTGGGSGTGFAALQNQSTDLANASRKIKAAEITACVKAFNKRPTEYKVCLDGLSVYVNAENPIKELTLDQLEGIFTGRIRTWKELGGGEGFITIYSRENSSGTYEFFKEHVLKGKDFAATAQPMQGTAQVLESVSKDKGGIGYGGAAYGAGARALAIVISRKSPARRPFDSSRMAVSSISTSRVSSSESSSRTDCASESSRSTSPLIEFFTAREARLAIMSSLSFRPAISCS